MNECINPDKISSLKLFEIKEVNIFSKCKWNNTGVLLEKGCTYELQAIGNWSDKNIITDSNGYTSNRVPWYSYPFFLIGEFSRRQSDSNWFKLIGCFGKQEKMCFEIGTYKRITPLSTNVLYCYANDISYLYDNNSGYVKLFIQKIN